MNAPEETSDPASDDLRSWLGQTLSGDVVAWKKLLTGNSRTTWLADVKIDGKLEPVVLRSEAGDGPFDGTELDLAREAAVYRGLDGRGVAIPRLLGFDATNEVIAMSRVAGTEDWTEAALGGLLEELGRLHSVPADEMDLPGFERTSAGDVRVWQRIAEQKIAPESELITFACDFLLRHHPGEPRQITFCHGDAGPGNFLHRDGVVTGLLDWEFAHFGDPIDDLAWITVRANLFGVDLPDFAAKVRERYRPDGVDLDQDRLTYWQAVVVLRNLVTCLASVSNPVRGKDRLVHLMIIPPLQVMLIDSLARIAGLELDRVDPPEAVASMPGADVVAEIAANLGGLIGDLDDDEQVTRAKRMKLLSSQLAETIFLAPSILAADTAEPVETGEEARLNQLSRFSRRNLALYPKARALADRPFAGF